MAASAPPYFCYCMKMIFENTLPGGISNFLLHGGDDKNLGRVLTK